jgi:hypothetical protein
VRASREGRILRITHEGWIVEEAVHVLKSGHSAGKKSYTSGVPLDPAIPSGKGACYLSMNMWAGTK